MRILDLDGPILDGRERHYACYRDVLADIGRKPLSINEYWALKRDGVCSTDILARSDASAYNATFIARWRSLIEQPQYLALDRLQDGATEKLAAWGHSALITMRQNEQAVHAQLEHFGIRAYFHTIIVVTHGEKAGKITPAPGAIWIGDTEADAQAAKAAGVTCYLVENGLRNPAFLSRLTGTIVPSIREVP